MEGAGTFEPRCPERSQAHGLLWSKETERREAGAIHSPLPALHPLERAGLQEAPVRLEALAIRGDGVCHVCEREGQT